MKATIGRGKGKTVLRYIIKRLLIMIPTVFVVAVLVFTVVNIIPGDPAIVAMGLDTVGDIDLVRERMGLDRGFFERMFDWMFNALRGDLGDSFFLGRTVMEAILPRIPVTLSLATAALAVGVIVGIPFGIVSSLKPNSPMDTGIMGVSLLGVSVPEFFVGLICMFIFALNLRWFPTGGYSPLGEEGFVPWIRSIALPAMAFGIGQAAYIARLMRSSMLEALNQDYIITARSKGQSEWKVVMKHALRNALLPTVTAVGMVYAMLLGGAFITESLFRIPGAGSLIISSIQRRDYPVVQGALLFVSVAILMVNLLVDILYAVIDPRVRYEKKK